MIHQMGMDQFGLLSVVWAIIGYVVVLEFGLGRVATKVMAEGRLKKEFSREITSSIIILTFLNIIGGSLLFYFSDPLVKTFFEIPKELQPTAINSIQTIGVFSFAINFSAFFRGVLEGVNQFAKVNFIHVLIGSSNFIIPVVVWSYSPNIESVVFWLMVARSIGAIAFGAVALKELSLTISWDTGAFKRVFHFGGWMTVSHVIANMLLQIDKLILGATGPVQRVSFFSAPFEMIYRVNIIPGALLRAVFPVFADGSEAHGIRVRKIYLFYLKFINFLLYPILLGLAYFSSELLTLWIGSDFASQSTIVMQWVSLGVLLNSGHYLPFGHLQGSEKANFSGKIHLVLLPIQILATYFFILEFGLLGAALAWVFRSFCETTMIFYFSTKTLFENGHPFLKIYIFQTIWSFLSWGILVFLTQLESRFIVYLVVVVAFVFLHLKFIYSKEEKERIADLLKLIQGKIFGTNKPTI